MTENDEDFSKVSGDYFYDYSGLKPIEEKPDPIPDLMDDDLYQTLLETNTKLLEEISEIKRDRDSQLERLQQSNISLNHQLISVSDEYDEKVNKLENALAEAAKGLRKQTDSSIKLKRNETYEIARLTRENARLDKQRKKCAKLAENSMVNFKFLKKKLLEAIDFENGSSNFKDLQGKLDRVSVEKERLKTKLRVLQKQVDLDDHALEKAKHKISTLEGKCDKVVDHAKDLEKERDDLIGVLKEMRAARTRSISVENEGPRSLLEEMGAEGNASFVGYAGHEPETANACQRLRKLLYQLKNDGDPPSDYDDENCPPGMLSSLVEEIYRLTLPGRERSQESNRPSSLEWPNPELDDYDDY